MLEARLNRAELLKKVLDAIKELVTDANFDCSEDGIKLQAMDNSHVALVSLVLNADAFESFRCDRNMSLGMSLASLTKIIKCAGNDDVVTLRADESQDILGMLFENKQHDRMGEYEMKLMDIDQEHLGIPDTVYDAEITLPAVEFARIIRDLKELGESVKIEVSKEGVRFSSEGDIGNAAVTLKQTTSSAGKDAMDEDSDEEEDEEEEDKDDDEEEEKVIKSDDDDDDVIVEAPATAGEDDSDEVVIKSDPEVVSAGEDDEDEDEPVKPKKSIKKEKVVVKKEKKPASKRKAPATKAKGSKKAKSDKKEDEPRKVTIILQQAVALTFSIKYLANFAKSTPLSDYVHLHMSSEVPLLVEYPFEQGHIRYYLAPKIADE